MKKELWFLHQQTRAGRLKDIVVVLIFFLVSQIYFRILESSLENNILGIAFLIAGFYGFLCLANKVHFVFS